MDFLLLESNILPSISIIPPSISSKPFKHLKKVLFPDPEDPIITTTSPF